MQLTARSVTAKISHSTPMCSWQSFSYDRANEGKGPGSREIQM